MDGTDERKKLTQKQQERVAGQDQTNFTTNRDGLEVKSTARQNSEREKADGDGGPYLKQSLGLKPSQL